MKIRCEVAYAHPDRQCVVTVEVESGSTLADAIHYAGLMAIFPDIDLETQPIGVFSQPRALSDKVCDGDRIEIYRLLKIDPKEARRSKARKRGG